MTTYYTPGHQSRNPYGKHGSYKSWLDQGGLAHQSGNAPKDNYLSRAAARQNQQPTSAQQSVNQATDYGNQLLELLGNPFSGGGSPNFSAGGVPGAGDGGGSAGGGQGAGQPGSGLGQTTGQINPMAPFDQNMTNLAVSQALNQAFVDPQRMRAQMAGGSGLAANSPHVNMMMGPQIGQMMSNMALQQPTLQFQDASANAAAMLPQLMSGYRENLGQAQNLGSLSDMQIGSQLGSFQNLLQAIFSMLG